MIAHPYKARRSRNASSKTNSKITVQRQSLQLNLRLSDRFELKLVTMMKLVTFGYQDIKIGWEIKSSFSWEKV